MKIGFALITAAPFFNKIIALENTFHHTAGFFDSLGETSNLPHTTLFQGEFDEAMDYRVMADDFAREFIRLFPDRSMNFQQIQYVPDGWYFLECEQTTSFFTLHNYVLKELKPYIVLDPNRLSRDTKALTSVQYDAIDQYGYRYAGEAFYPHITIGRTSQKNEKLLEKLNSAMADVGYTSRISKLTVYRMGNNGTHAETLYEVLL